MIVVDSSYLTEGVLVDEGLLKRDGMVAPDLAIYEAIGAIWKYQVVLGRISDGKGYLEALADLVSSNRLIALKPGDELMDQAYDLAVRYHAHPHDTVFVALAVMTGLDLETLDQDQRRMHGRERARRESKLGSGGRGKQS